MLRMPFLLALIVLSVVLAPAQAPDRRLNVAFLVWDGMELIESLGPAHVFSFAPGMDEYTVSSTTEAIRSEFITIVPEYRLDNCPEPDVIVIPGGSIWTPLKDETIRAWLRRHVPKSLLTVSVCNSAILLAELGLLDGRDATCADGNLDDIMIRGQNVRGLINRRWVHSGNVITSKSYLGGIDAAIYAVRVLRGESGERQVLEWSNYDGTLSKYDALHAEPGIVPISRRREIHHLIMNESVDAAVARFREWVQSGKPAYTPPLDKIAEEDMFQWMAWGYQSEGKFEESIRICSFKAKAWPDSAKQRAYLGEAYQKGGDFGRAIEDFLAAEALEPGNSVTLRLLERALHDPAVGASEVACRGRSVLEKHASNHRGRLINRGEPGESFDVTGRVLDEGGTPLADARIHVFHADAKGHYSKALPREAATARLFAFIRTDDQGRFELETVRPGAPPARTEVTGEERLVPRRIHFEIRAHGCKDRDLELFFEGDPRLTDSWRERARRHANPIVAVIEGSPRSRCEVEIRLSRE